MRIASIDIGTNTILLLIAEVDRNGVQKVLHDEQVIARLGKGVDADRIINRETFLRVEKFLNAYKNTCNDFSVERIIATGTSALRDAKNREDFCNYMKQKIGMTIEVLSGSKEAQWTYRGGISEFAGRSDTFSVIDIGGGSTEIIIGNSSSVIFKTSIDIGSVRLSERILKVSPPAHTAIAEAHNYILSQIPKEVSGKVTSTFAIGVAGTVTTLAALHQQLPRYIPEKISGYKLLYKDVCVMFDMLKDKSVEQIKTFPQISHGRADIIVAGVLILMTFMETSRLSHIVVSDRGLRYGMIYREIEKVFN